MPAAAPKSKKKPGRRVQPKREVPPLTAKERARNASLQVLSGKRVAFHLGRRRLVGTTGRVYASFVEFTDVFEYSEQRGWRRLGHWPAAPSDGVRIQGLLRAEHDPLGGQTEMTA